MTNPQSVAAARSRSRGPRVLAASAAAAMVGSGLFLAQPTWAADHSDEPIPVIAGDDGSQTWTPEVDKNVLGAKTQPGSNADSSIEGLGVWPGQSAKYEIFVDRDAPEFVDADGQARAITGFSVRDKLPEGVSADLSTLTVIDPSAGGEDSALVAGRDYEAHLSEGNEVIVEFSEDWIAEHVGQDLTQRLSVVFTATLDEDAKPYSAVENHASQTISLAGVDSDGVLDPEADADSYTFDTQEPATVLVPGIEPTEGVYSVEDSTPVGERTVVGGDALDYKVVLDGTFGEDSEGENGESSSTPLDLAYDVSSFGIVDDYDEALVSVDPSSVVVTDSSGSDVTGSFETDVSDGMLRVTAVTNDDGVVDPDLFGQDYAVSYQAMVRKDVKEDSTIVGETVQVVDDREHPVASESEVSVAAISPSKTVVDKDGSREALDSVASGSEFWYRVVSSQHPAAALYPVTEWSAVDETTRGDQQLHDAWSVRAVGDIHDADGEVLFADGEVIADQDTRADWFSLSFSGDSWSATATEAFTDAVSSGRAPSEGDEDKDERLEALADVADPVDEVSTTAQWELFVSATRIADEGTRTSNTGHEMRNGVSRAASVTTDTGPSSGEEPGEEPGEDPKDDPSEDPKDDPKDDPSEKPSDDPSDDPADDQSELDLSVEPGTIAATDFVAKSQDAANEKDSGVIYSVTGLTPGDSVTFTTASKDVDVDTETLGEVTAVADDEGVVSVRVWAMDSVPAEDYVGEYSVTASGEGLDEDLTGAFTVTGEDEGSKDGSKDDAAAGAKAGGFDDGLPTTLPRTGSQGTALIAGAAASLLAGGGGLMWLSRRKKAGLEDAIAQ